MKLANATNLNRKSGVAKGRDLQFSQPLATSARKHHPALISRTKLTYGKLRKK
jgi:hypothetical protein